MDWGFWILDFRGNLKFEINNWGDSGNVWNRPDFFMSAIDFRFSIGDFSLNLKNDQVIRHSTYLFPEAGA
ncbi:hypothetical protein D0A34_02790 [Microcoleus vaginatus PCC 9802]|nr:hypothetical protein D0A34_02790 [Microcoleus vaginatus PCC 9802]